MKLTTARLKKLIHEELEKIEEATASSPMAQLSLEASFGGFPATLTFVGIGPKGMGFELPLKHRQAIADLKELANKNGKISENLKLLNHIMGISKNAKKFGREAIGEAVVSYA